MLINLTVNSKLNLPVQFMTFGVEHHGIIIPILRRGKDDQSRSPVVARPANDPAKTGLTPAR